jgi:hypothetical protein
MTREHISSFVGDLVQMAKAMEELPLVQERVHELEHLYDKEIDKVTALETKAHQRNQEMEALHSTIRTLEASRDDAEFRFLEAEERTASALAFVRTVFGNAGALIQALDPPKASEPTKVASDLPSNAPVVSVQPNPSDATEATGSDPDVFGNLATTSADVSLPQGQSEPDPIADGAFTTESIDALSGYAASQEPVASTDPSPGPYANKHYIDHPGWMSREDWLAGGGTNEDYDWREGSQSVA